MLLHVLLALFLGFALGTFVSFAAVSELKELGKYLLEAKRLILGGLLFFFAYVLLTTEQWLLLSLLAIVLLTILASELWWHSLSFELFYYGFFIVTAVLVVPLLSQSLYLLFLSLIFVYGFPSACLIHLEFRKTWSFPFHFHPRGVSRNRK